MTNQVRPPIIRALWELLPPYRWILPLLVLLGVLSALAEGIGISLFLPLLHGLDGASSAPPETGTWLVDTLYGLFSDVPPETRLYLIAALIFGSVCGKSALQFANGLLLSWLDTRLSHQIRSRLHRQMLDVSYGYLERLEQGYLLNVLATESWSTSRALGELAKLITAATAVLVYGTLLLMLSWPLTLLAAGAVGGIALLVRWITRHMDAYSARATAANRTLADRMIEALGAMKLIRSFNRQAYEQDRFDQASGRVSRLFFRMGIIGGLVTPVYEVLAAAVLVTILVGLFYTSYSLPTFLVFLFILYRLQPQVRTLDSARVALRSVSAGVNEVVSFLDRSDKPYLPDGNRRHTGLQRGIQFRDVSFRYAPDASPALRDVTFDVPAGSTTALVGPSGAGKSTLIKLLLRLHDPTRGTIMVDGAPLADLSLESWREHLAIVSQDVTIFDATIRENIAYGRLDATDADIEAAARFADAYDFITRLPDGFDTHVGSRGVRLSGGQQQRISLARALVRDPSLLILDEATNALDSLSEHAIQTALDTLRADRTVVMIAHRFSTIENADQIIVLDEGRVVEQGSFSALLAQDGLFTRMYLLQHQSSPLHVPPDHGLSIP